MRLESQFNAVRQKLAEIGYQSGRIALITRVNPNSQPRSADDDRKWFEAQYNLVPLVVWPWTADTPVVLGSFAGEALPLEIPGFIKLYDDGKGLVLLQRASTK